ncbi:MAG: lamin tail domain-containing protein [Verrucomicrobiales bacterium]|nr:lamin tail domain-containing protein [Verrucomicrobiales bacterium]
MSSSRWLYLGAVLFSLASQPLTAAPLIPSASNWRWRPGTSEASTPLSAWRAIDFSDSEFTTAPAPFWYGDVLDGGTQIQGMQNNYGCIFLRKTFVVADALEVGGLSMTALVDDGFVAWINGTEVLRVGMPGDAGSEVTRGTLANNATEPVAFAFYNLPPPSSYLLSGTNVLAVQVFQSSLTSSDLGFDASLDAVVRETVPPRILSVTPSPDSTVERLAQLTVTFSEPVTGVVAAHLLVNGIGAADVVSLDASTYMFRFSQPGYGAVSIGWNPLQTITDLAQPPNRFDAASAGATFSFTLVDRTPPTMGGVTPIAGSTTRELTTASVLFSEAVTGVDAGDLLINGQPASTVTAIAATQYLFTFAPPPTGVVNVAWSPSHGIADQASPSNAFGGGNWTYVFDPNAPESLPYISEFMASNTRTLRDETGDYPDWIEIYNPSAAPVNLEGWYLTDATNNPTKWRFPSTNVAGNGFLVVRASGKDRRTPGSPLHTSFQLGTSGEHLALVRPDGISVASDFGISYPQQIPDVSFGVIQVSKGDTWEKGAEGVYFLTPTPGQPNLGGTAVPGPIIAMVQHAPQVPNEQDDLLVTARILPSFTAVGSVELRYRVQFGAEATTPMLDDGMHGDGMAGDGVFGAWIPASAASGGQMVRYYIVATDTAAKTSRWPLFTDPNATAEYLGTIVAATNAVSALPVFHLFVAPNQMSRIDSESGGRASFFYDGELYDNIGVEVRGNTSAGLNKKSHRIEFNRGHELRHAGPGGRTRRSSLLAEHLDPTYLRQYLCFWLLNNIGDPAPYNYPVRVHLNGQFYQLAFHSDVIGKEQMERMGYDPAGALYKAVGNLVPSFSSTGVFQKLEPEGDPSRTDYLELANGINESSPIEVRRRTVFDQLDVPQVINHLAGTRWCAENDDVWANMSLYRDTFGDGLWRNIPFDMNASWGQLYGGSSPLEATVDGSKSHPLYGGSSTESNFNRLYDVIVRLPETRAMLLRRQRSIMDRWIQPPETPAESRILENHIRQMTNLIAADARLDRTKWGTSPWAPGKTFEAGVGDLINQFIVPRRRHWYATHSITNTARPIGVNNSDNAGIPLSQPADARLSFVGVEFSPSSGNQSQEYILLTNASPVAIDITDWKLAGAVNFTFKPGTVVPAGGRIYVSPDVRQFRARSAGPRGGQGLFVVGPYGGQLSARGEELQLTNDRGQMVSTYSYAGAPSPAQQFLRVTEVHFHPAAAPGNLPDAEEFEFLELRNLSPDTTLDLRGVRFIDGIQFDFTSSRFTSLAPGARLIVVANAVAFASRYGGDLAVAGEYVGRLDNGGERLRLVDAANEEVLDFTYKDTWQPSTDGQGYSLVVVDEKATPDSWSMSNQWKASGVLNGTPGRADETTPRPPDPPRLDVQADSARIVLRFLAASNQTYTMQSAETLPTKSWERRLDFEAQGSDREVEWSIPLAGQGQYFRLVTPKQP